MRLIRVIGLMGLTFLAALVYLGGKSAKPVATAQTADSPFGLIGLRWEEASELNSFWGKLIIPWQLIEPTRGDFRFDELDRGIEAAGPVNLVGLLKANALWAVSCRRFVGLGNACPPANANDYARFVAKVVSRYGNRIKVWQIEDEVYGSQYGGSVDDYLAILATATQLIKQVDPAAKVLLASTNLSGDKAYRERFTQIAAQSNQYDYLDVHLRGDEALVGQRLNDFSELLKSHKVTKPVWMTELAPQQGATHGDLVRLHASAFGGGVEKIFWYSELSELDIKAYAIMASLLTNHSSSAFLNLGPNIKAVLFEFTGGKPVAVVWSTSPGAEFNTAEIFTGRSTVLDTFGRMIKTQGSLVRPQKEPVYLVGSRLAVSRFTTPATRLASQDASILTKLDTNQVKVGQLLTATVALQSESAVSFVKVHLSFPADLVRVRRVEHAGSAFSLVVEERFDNAKGELTLAKAGLLGEQAADLSVARVIFETLRPGAGQLLIKDSDAQTNRVLNLKGEHILGSTKAADFTIE